MGSGQRTRSKSLREGGREGGKEGGVGEWVGQREGGREGGRYGCQNDGLDELDTTVMNKESEGGREGGRATLTVGSSWRGRSRGQ